ncbi:3-phosphoserine/phosphohydroxythreonine transaminase [Jeotgalibacillus haloalkalitolerans]|uniref:Phosphoserine aminotransferase n=1 Tax=Jeotgalibacillus haloalkalitolerans TaxID=3104292 RepID=A0ABU5KKL2_9BACL|nr:3-phosphoserine/phosphohydroxythreonine transaminase [Jeotgalibacillus sp. HH7-29]MDZ5711286.1 3-phosphoserine/phosphohydroxythreonine transaminase [Jeotgalibacillus sp. HH7-29]
MDRVVNFSAGPSAMPLEVLMRAQSELVDTNHAGMSVMEMSHRSKAFEDILENTKHLLKKVMNIPENYKILFLQGGASLQFSMIPLNLLQKDHEAAYIITGSWSQKALKEAKKVGQTTVIATSEETQFRNIPDFSQITQFEKLSYVHITGNNTIEGTRFTELPKTDAPIINDWSSGILSEEINVSDYGVIYAGAQKNLGPSGVTVVIIREDLIGHAPDHLPTMLDYKTHEKSDSLYNTPPTFGIYMIGLMLEWIDSLGGVKEIEKRNREKASLLYETIDQSNLFYSPVKKEDRSLMNIPFKTDSEETDKAFIEFAASKQLVELKGHRSVGGMRASMYNAMPIEHVERLCDAMREFEAKIK